MVGSSPKKVADHHMIVDPDIDTQVSVGTTRSGRVLENKQLIYKQNSEQMAAKYEPPKKRDELVTKRKAMVVEILGLDELKPIKRRIIMADQSIKTPEGVIYDVLVKVDKSVFLADFVIIDFEINIEVPIILGRPFLLLESIGRY
ncbi:hypothetical protein RDI58_001131 [Solanum bulbocastanum]|uniref:Uncharacterized protein n=1 Tax=Solanum bulbocastanum TaxID=147425 RepID=A0AAN8U2B4_SOLBU